MEYVKDWLLEASSLLIRCSTDGEMVSARAARAWLGPGKGKAGGTAHGSTPSTRARDTQGQRRSGLFYCHLKTTFKTRLSLPKGKKKKKNQNRTKEMGPFEGSLEHASGTPWALARLLRCQPQPQGVPRGVAASLWGSILHAGGMCPWLRWDAWPRQTPRSYWRGQ